MFFGVNWERIDLMKRNVTGLLILPLAAVLLLVLVLRFRTVFFLLMLSLIFAYLLHPAVNGFGSRGVPLPAAILVSYGIFFTVLLFFLLVILPLLYNEFIGIFDALPVYYQYVLDLWDHYVTETGWMDFLGNIGFNEKVLSFLNARTERFAAETVHLLTLLPRFALYALLVPVISYYFLRDKNQIAGGLLMMFPPSVRVTAATLWEEVDGVLMAFIRGNLLVAFIVGLLTTVGLFLLGVEYAAVLGFLYGILDIIPYFGPFLGAIPTVLLPLMQGDVNMFLLVLLLFSVQQFENFFISPRILGDRVGLHPVTVIVLVLVGGYCGGILGMVGMIPLAAVGKVLLIFLYRRYVAAPID